MLGFFYSPMLGTKRRKESSWHWEERDGTRPLIMTFRFQTRHEKYEKKMSGFTASCVCNLWAAPIHGQEGAWFLLCSTLHCESWWHDRWERQLLQCFNSMLGITFSDCSTQVPVLSLYSRCRISGNTQAPVNTVPKLHMRSVQKKSGHC